MTRVAAVCPGPGHDKERPMELDPLPDLGELSDDQLKAMIDDLKEAERQVSMQRRLLHGRIDILHQELVRRLAAKDEGALSVVDVDALARILAERVPDMSRLEGEQ
ncbi:MAG TPA: hypothetical protein VNT51_00070 [Miltoncostaeaceae bacterium]|nr:hypothetical protein [Miltoncostaeaceae bacterium]